MEFNLSCTGGHHGTEYDGSDERVTNENMSGLTYRKRCSIIYLVDDTSFSRGMIWV